MSTPLLGLVQIADGTDNNTWGPDFNNNAITPLENAVQGVQAFSTTGGTTNVTEAQRVMGGLALSGTLASNATFVIQNNVSKWWAVLNGCVLGASTVSFKTSAGSPTVVPAGLHIVICDGSNNIIVF